MNSVLQDWVMELPLKMQSVLMTSTRGPDNHRYDTIKILNRWIRARILKDADPANPFMRKATDSSIMFPAYMDQLEHDCEYVTVHYFGHLIHALEIIAYKHPIDHHRIAACTVYVTLCGEILHLPIEPEPVMDDRLSDKTEGVVHE